MRLLVTALGGLVFPPLLALVSGGMRYFVVFCVLEAVVLVTFFLVAWGPAVLAQVILWMAGLWLAWRMASPGRA